MVNRYHEAFREQLRKSIDKDDMRLMSQDSLSRVADPEAVNRYRLEIYKQQSQAVQHILAVGSLQRFDLLVVCTCNIRRGSIAIYIICISLLIATNS